MRRHGLQAEILASLAVVMVTASAVLGVLLVRIHETQLRQLQRLAARALLEELQSPVFRPSPVLPELRSWIVGASGESRARGSHTADLDPRSRALAAEARAQQRSLLQAGAPWEPVRFATPLDPRSGDVAVAWLPPTVSRLLLLGILLGDVGVFTAFGAYLLRRRLGAPLERLAGAARAIADGAFETRAPVEGTRETADLGSAFNEMTEALEGRSAALEKAVAELRESNRELREARAGLDRAERLAAVGRLAAGVAHEVGNPLGALLAFQDLAGRDPGLSEEGRQHLQRAGREGQRVRGILRQLLDFSRPPRTRREPVDVVRVCRDTVELMAAQRRYAGIRFDVRQEGEPFPALADRNTLSQILLNLLLNAGDALRERADGDAEPRVVLRVRGLVAKVRRGEEEAPAVARRPPDTVECRIEDNGPGIPAELRSQVFDPFFSTKEPGEGTGLGLSNAARFAEELGGSLELDETHAGPGAAFVLRLPAALRGGPGSAVR